MSPLRVFLVEDEVLLLMQLESFLEDDGHVITGTALSSREAIAAVRELDADVALVDIHLLDGPTGIDVGRFITERTKTALVFMTANPKRISDDFSGAIGVIGKPYTKEGLRSAVDYLEGAIRNPPPMLRLPPSLTLAPNFALKWSF